MGLGSIIYLMRLTLVSLPSRWKPPHEALPRHRTADRDHGRAPRSRDRLPLGHRAGFRDDCALHGRGSARGRRRHRPERHARPPGRAWRPVASDGLSRSHGRGAGAFAFPDVVEAITTSSSAGIPTSSATPMPAPPVRPRTSGRRSRLTRRLPAVPSAAGPTTRRVCFDDVARGLPPLTRALKLQEKASTVGFDWNDPESGSCQAPRGDRRDRSGAGGRHPGAGYASSDEVGDLLFAVVNLARHLGADPEQALRGTNAKFETRFAAIEAALAKQGRTPAEASLDEMEALGSKRRSQQPTRLPLIQLI